MRNSRQLRPSQKSNRELPLPLTPRLATMLNGTDQSLYDVEAVLFTLVLVGLLLGWLSARLRRSRPAFSIGFALTTSVTVRLLAVGAVSVVAPTIRGGDESIWLQEARDLSQLPSLSKWIDAFTASFGRQPGPNSGNHPGSLHTWLFAIEMRIGHFPELAMRIVQVGISVAGLVLLAAAVYDLAGPRAARLASWILALEPTNVFFSGFLHKEPLMLFASGLTVLGAVRIWQRRDRTGVVLLVMGCVVAVGTRPYAGYFLIGGAVALCLHAALTRRGQAHRRSLQMASILVLLVLVATPTVLSQTSDQQIRARLAVSQQANAASAANLNLETVQYSNRADVVLNLPLRIADVVLQPYPWQLGSTSQRLGIGGSMIAYAVLFLILRLIFLARWALLRRAGPIVYPAVFLLLAYSVSAANAGTSFRLRTTVVTLAICVILVMREPASAPLRRWHDSTRRSPDEFHRAPQPAGTAPVAVALWSGDGQR